MPRTSFHTLVLALLTVSSSVLMSCSCGAERLVESACRVDADCENGYLCENYICVPREAKACEVVIDGNPILQPAPHVADFGKVDTAVPVTLPMKIHNIGNCTLTVFEATLTGDSGLGCEFCTTEFPKEIFPGRELPMELTFTGTNLGPASGTLVFLSDDREYPELIVPVHANFIGVPKPTVAPNPIDYGYVAEGRIGKKTVTITNQGTGTAPMQLTSVELNPSDTTHFSMSGLPTLPLAMKPTAVDSSAVVELEVRYHPRTTAIHTAELVVTTDKGEVRVPLSGNAETPPRLTISPLSIDLGNVPLGRSNFKPLTLLNEGGAPLQVKAQWGGMNPSTDLYATPSAVPPIAAGQYLEMQVAVQASQLGQISGLLIITSNDPLKPSVTIPVTANGIPNQGPEVVKVEMTFDNGSDSFFDNDIRNVDMTLEHPYGYVCNKQYPTPTNWGNYGNPTWLGFAPKEEPERIILADAIADGTYRVMLTYAEDCSSLPSALVAGVLGISLDLLIDYLTGGVVNIPGQDLSQIIAQMCLSHSSSNAAVRVWVNGTLVKETTATVGRKGDSVTVLDLVRANGAFTVP